MRTYQKVASPKPRPLQGLAALHPPVLAPERMPMAHALARSARFVQGTLRSQKKGGKASRAGDYAKGVSKIS